MAALISQEKPQDLPSNTRESAEVRIPTKSITHSEGSRSVIPIHADHLFQFMSITIGAKRRWLFDLSFIPLIESIVVVVVTRWLPALSVNSSQGMEHLWRGARGGDSYLVENCLRVVINFGWLFCAWIPLPLVLCGVNYGQDGRK